MRTKRVLTALAFGATGLVLSTATGLPAARADVGVERITRSAGAPGDRVALTLGCGFCFPPCEGPKGDRRPAGFERGPCMRFKGAPPESFGVSLVPVAKVPGPIRCKSGGPCSSPRAQAPPRRAPFAFLGLATPPPGGNNPEDGDVPRYLLSFEVPDLRPGTYAFVLYCDACLDGPGGTLIPLTPDPRFRVRAG